ncbi:hypothetical protein D5R55_24400 [Burkholderia cenocepacia]|uniref:Uncharacterized protein n=2 Tax=Burkholderia cenocepacia TaxID=95486 RepID=A0A3S9NET3_9BURK|nr:hypothetical protein D5R55_24400 [Burkholderia cenocepacia]
MAHRIMTSGRGGSLSSSASRIEFERPIETHAATAHQSSGKHDIVCALCGVCFAIGNAEARLNRMKNQ